MIAMDNHAKYPFSILTGLESGDRRLFEQSPVACMLVSRDGTIVDFNRRAADLLLIDPERRSQPELTGYVSPTDLNGLLNHFNDVLYGRQQHALDVRIQLSDGQDLPIRLVSSPLDDNPDLCLSVLMETGIQPGNVRVLSHLAYYDQLTGLPNRLLFNDRLRWAIRDARRRDEFLAVMFIDLDNFKIINEDRKSVV